MRALPGSLLLAGLPSTSIAGSNDPASLDHLADIITLPAVPFWPPAQGWYWLLAILLAVIFLFSGWKYLRSRRNAYRTAALNELDALGSDSDALYRIAEILKRVSFYLEPRQELGQLNGEAWVEWLNRRGNGALFQQGPAKLLSRGIYRGDRPATADIEELKSSAQLWIRKHGAVPPSRCKGTAREAAQT